MKDIRTHKYESPLYSCSTLDQAIEASNKSHYPVWPSFDLGRKFTGEDVVFNDEELREYLEKNLTPTPERPVLIQAARLGG